MFLVEVFAGSARVTACLRYLGMTSAFGADCKCQRAAAKVVLVDLTKPNGQALMWTWLKADACLGFFAAPPCGTASRAREIKLRLPDGRVVNGPKPLRSELAPDGLPFLGPTDRSRVSAANQLYHFLTQIALHCHATGRIVCIENPRNSLYWKTSFFSPLRHVLEFTAHQACAYGSDRPKMTVLAHNRPAFRAINRACPGESATHVHKPWGLVDGARPFATQEETAYPPQLAYTIATCLHSAALDAGWVAPDTAHHHPEELPLAHLRAITGSQPKASRMPPLVSEFQQIMIRPRPASGLPCPLGQSLASPYLDVPAGAKLLRPSGVGKKGEVGIDDLAFGVYRSPEDFVDAAVKAGHPISFANRLPQPLSKALQVCMDTSPKVLLDSRLSELKRWSALAQTLESEEKQLHESLPQHGQAILAPKRILLWQTLLKEYGYHDLGVVNEVIEGTQLVGIVDRVPAFAPTFKPAQRSIPNLKECAKASREALIWSARSSGDSFLDAEVYRKTLLELEAGWLVGPIDPKQLPEDAVVSRRFGLKQSAGGEIKVRLIDDFSASGVNATVQVESKPPLHTLDVVAAAALEITRKGQGGLWLGKTFDLSAAYRQLYVAESSLWAAYLVCFDPVARGPKVFQIRALPFGASRSVYSFLRVAHSIWWLGATALNIVWTSFFDDFVTFARASEAAVMEGIISQFFRILGWLVSGGDKSLPFAIRFKALGVEISLESCASGVITFENTRKRVEELLSTIKAALAEGRLSQAAALSLRGRMQFAKSQLSSRVCKLCLAAVGRHATDSSSQKLTGPTVEKLKMFSEILASSPPRVIGLKSEKPWQVYTDASFEPSQLDWPCGLGGLLYDPSGSQVQAFSFSLSTEHLRILGYPPKKTVIFEAELLAVVASLHLWSAYLSNAPCVFFVDNNAARDVAISGTAKTAQARGLLGELLSREDELGIVSWYARVPSASNPADAPSRNSRSGVQCASIEKEHVSEMVTQILAAVGKEKTVK